MRPFASAMVGAAALVASAVQAQPVQPGERVETELLTVKAPNTPGWSVGTRAPARLSFSRTGAGPNSTLAAMVVAFRIDVPASREQFMALIARGVEADTPAPRFRAIRSELTPEEVGGRTCVRYIALHEDREARTFVAPRGPILMQSHTLYCLVPQEAGVALAAGYSHRGELAPESTDAEAREFIAGVGLRPR